jgi:uncharacterized damage-inducible protein DinB
MTYAETILPEFDHEMASTRKVLERLPEDKLDWRPHPKSNTIGWNANHLADLPAWASAILTNKQFDYAPVGGPRYELPNFHTRQEIVDLFDRNVATARKALEAVKDDEAKASWTLLGGGKPMFTKPRSAVMRSFVMNHIIHHRAILCVYLRLNDVPVPGMYGPSGDE